MVGNPVGDQARASSRSKNRVSLRSSSRIRPLKLSTKPFGLGFPGAMKCQSIAVPLPGEHGIAGELGAVVGHDHSWLAAALDDGRQLAGDAPSCISGMAPKHSLVTSSTMLSTRKAPAIGELVWTNSSDQRVLGPVRSGSGPDPHSFAAGSSLADGEPFFPIKPVYPVDPRRLALPQQGEHPVVAETPPLVGEIAQPAAQS